MKTSLPSGFHSMFQEKAAFAIFKIMEENHAPLLEQANRIINNAAVAEYLLITTYLKMILLRKNLETWDDILSFLTRTLTNACYDYLKYSSCVYPPEIMRSLPEFVSVFNIEEEIERWDIAYLMVVRTILFNSSHTEESINNLSKMQETTRRQKLLELQLFRSVLDDKLQGDWVL